MKNKKHELHHMTWREAEESFSSHPVLLIPMGSMEEHGPHSITGDYIAAYEIAKRAAGLTDSLCVPPIPFGHSEYFRGFPGTISLAPDTVYMLARDVALSLMEHGIDRIIFVNGHFGNGPILDRLAREIRRERGIVVGKIDLWQSLTPGFKKELYDNGTDPSGHGGEPLTSVMHYLRPDDMRMDLLEKPEASKTWEGFDVVHVSRTKLEDISVSMYFDMEDVSRQGVMGNPHVGSAEIGEKIVNKLVGYVAAFARKMKKAHPHVMRKG